MRWYGTARTDIGKHRAINQDSFGFADDLRLWVIADGMSTPPGGEVASRIAVETFIGVVRNHGKHALPSNDAKQPDVPALLEQAMAAANEEVRRQAASHPALAGMGSTLSALCINGQTAPQATVAHIGDSRVYLLREGRLRLITHDHSYVEALFQAGRISRAQALTHPMRHVLTRALGPDAEVKADLATTVWHQNDRFLLCTDGLTKMLPDHEIERILQTFLHEPEHACQHLIDAANLAGGEDNTTVLVIAD